MERVASRDLFDLARIATAAPRALEPLDLLNSGSREVGLLRPVAQLDRRARITGDAGRARGRGRARKQRRDDPKRYLTTTLARPSLLCPLPARSLA